MVEKMRPDTKLQIRDLRAGRRDSCEEQRRTRSLLLVAPRKTLGAWRLGKERIGACGDGHRQ